MHASFLSEDSLLHLRPQVAIHVCLLCSYAGSTGIIVSFFPPSLVVSSSSGLDVEFPLVTSSIGLGSVSVTFSVFPVSSPRSMGSCVALSTGAVPFDSVWFEDYSPDSVDVDVVLVVGMVLFRFFVSSAFLVSLSSMAESI